MRIVLFASGEFALPTLRWLAESSAVEHRVEGLVTQPDRASGRGRKASSTPAKVEALRLGIPVLDTGDVNGAEAGAWLKSRACELGLVIAFGQKMGGAVRQLFRHECVNLHASLLPKYRGAAPFQWAVINGERQTGVTVFRLVDRMDAGPIYAARETEIGACEQACELHDRLAVLGVEAVRKALDILSSNPGFEPAAQNDGDATRAPKLRKHDGVIRFNAGARELACRINGLWDWPGAACLYVPSDGRRAEQVTLVRARHRAGPGRGLAPGSLDGELRVAATDGMIEVLEIRPSAGRVMGFRDFVNGRRVREGDRFVAAGGA